MPNRDRMLDAAQRVYAQYGFRGATTRLIAIEAGVNEVTLFRTFGSKAALLTEMMRSMSAGPPIPELPDNPVDPERELTAWCAATLAHMRASSSLIRKSMAEVEDRPAAATFACKGPTCGWHQLHDYVQRLGHHSLSDPEADAPTATSMFISALFGDAMSRELIPDAFPKPANQAAAKYVRVFMRAIGVRSASAPPKRGKAAMSR